MSWNPFKRRDEEPPQSAAGQAGAGQYFAVSEDDPTDPLIQTAAFTQSADLLRDWPGVRLESVTVSAANQTADSFLRLVVDHDGPLSRALPELLTRGGALFGLRDLLADGNCALAASLEEPQHSFAEMQTALAQGQIILRPLDILLAVQELAAGLELARGHALGWQVNPAGLAFEHSGPDRSGLARWQLRFTGFGELLADSETDAAEIVTLFRPLLDTILDRSAARLLPAATHFDALQALLERLQHLPQLSLATLRDELARSLAGLRISGCGLTDTGLKRQHNEDAWCLVDVRQQSAIGSQFLLAAVADGMGGHESGEIASSLALAMLRQQLQIALIAPSSRGSDPQVLALQLENIIPAINRALSDRSAMDPALAGMGTTLCGFALLRADSTLRDDQSTSAAVFNVGDSRVYLIGPCSLQRLSRDHSFVQDLVDNGDVSEDEAFDHPRKNVITRCLGGDGQEIGADVWPFRPGPCERLLICSDGLSDALRDADIRRVLADNADAAMPVLAQRLVAAANAAGGPDNITVLLLDCLL